MISEHLLENKHLTRFCLDLQPYNRNKSSSLAQGTLRHKKVVTRYNFWWNTRL